MSKKRDVVVTLNRKKRMSFNLFDKNCTQENDQLHLRACLHETRSELKPV